MIAWHLILLAAALTAVAVAIASLVVRWDPPSVVMASAGALLLIVAWRAVANGMQWNGDFTRLVSIGDVGCLVAGAVAPAVVSLRSDALSRSTLPALVGGLMGFAANVMIL